jgi:Ran GTPase-activating protein (RanGAP) involved in mRNA processing and transport
MELMASNSIVDAIAAARGNEPRRMQLMAGTATATPDQCREFWAAMATNWSMRSLHIYRVPRICNYTRAIADVIAQNTTLRVLALQGCQVSQARMIRLICPAFAQNTTLSQLALGDFSMTDAAVTALAEALTVNHSVKAIQLNNIGLRDAGVLAIAQSLRHNPDSTLNTISLTRHAFIKQEGFDGLASMLRDSQTLTKLDLRTNRINASYLQDIALALKCNTTLRHLDLSRNPLCYRLQENVLVENRIGLPGLGEALRVNHALLTLNVRRCAVDASLTGFINDIQFNNGLTSLDLSGNMLSRLEVHNLCVMLTAKTTLTDLSINSCDMEDESIVQLTEILQTQTSLTKLDISRNYISEVCAAEMALMLTKNYALRTLTIQVDSPAKAELFYDALKVTPRNYKLKLHGIRLRTGMTNAEVMDEIWQNLHGMYHAFRMAFHAKSGGLGSCCGPESRTPLPNDIADLVSDFFFKTQL